MTSQTGKTKAARYGMVVDLDRCNGCGACMLACAVENNVAPAAPGATDRTGITPLRVYRYENEGRVVFDGSIKTLTKDGKPLEQCFRELTAA